MPECKLGLNDRVLLEAQGRTTKGKAIDLEDIKFHQYVCWSSLYLENDNLDWKFCIVFLSMFLLDASSQIISGLL